jgi:tight adherence protein C
MVWTVTAVTFFASVAIVGFLMLALAPNRVRIAQRLSRMLDSPVLLPNQGFSSTQKERLLDTLASVGKLLPVGRESPQSQLLLVRSGFRSTTAFLALRGVQLLLVVGLVAAVFAAGLHRSNPVFFPLLAAVCGFLLPEVWLIWRAHSRQRRLRRSLPDCLDLLVISVEAGLGLDQALLKVAQEMRITHRELSEELQLANLEMRIGKSRIDSLRELARRTGLEDIKSLVAMLIQTERFGTSVAQSLRVYSEDLRTRRRQRAEEMSAKTTVKIVPPLVFFIFPALLVVILGPAVIALVRQLMPTLQK